MLRIKKSVEKNDKKLKKVPAITGKYAKSK